MNAIALRDLVSVVNKRETDIQEFRQRIKAICGDMLMECALQGVDLAKLRANWVGEWQKAFPNIIKMNYGMAAKYIRLSENFDRLGLEKANSLAECEKLIAAERDAKRDHVPDSLKKAWPKYLECLKSVTAFTNRLNNLPAKDSPPEFVEQLKARLKPIVVRYWPEAKI